MKFELGQLVMTQGVAAKVDNKSGVLAPFINRHMEGDWGDLSAADKKLNDQAVKDGDRILSTYHLEDNTKIWIITEWDRSVTTVLLPEEY